MEHKRLLGLNLSLIIILLASSLNAYSQISTYPVKFSTRYTDNNKSSVMLPDEYFEINVVTDTPGQAPNVMFVLKPEATSDVMSDCIWFSKGSSSYIEYPDGIYLYSSEFPNQFAAIVEEVDDSGLKQYRIVFGYTDANDDVVEIDEVFVSKDSYQAIKQLVREQIYNLSIRKEN